MPRLCSSLIATGGEVKARSSKQPHAAGLPPPDHGPRRLVVSPLCPIGAPYMLRPHLFRFAESGRKVKGRANEKRGILLAPGKSTLMADYGRSSMGHFRSTAQTAG